MRAPAAGLVGVAALIAAAVILAVLVLGGGGDDYTIEARFQSAGQLVSGNKVMVAGTAIGSVGDIELADNGEAAVTLHIDDDRYRPLRQGTEAVVRVASLAGVANRYIDLRMPPAGSAEIPDGGTIASDSTTSAVELDQLFNTFDAKTRRGLSQLIRGAGAEWKGRSREARLGMLYLNPALASTTRLLAAVNGDGATLERFVSATSRLSKDVAERRDRLAGLIDHLSTTTDAIADRDDELGEAIELTPPVLRSANSTFVNLRSTLDDLDPLVEDARPATRALERLAPDLSELARGARPTVSSLKSVLSRPGATNDLQELLDSLPPLRELAVGPVQANGAERDGAFGPAEKAMRGFAPEVGFWRPYSVDLTGWFDDFSHTGVYDAVGGMGRITFNSSAFANVGGTLTYVPPDLRDDVLNRVASRGQRDRCPGAMERGTVWKPTPDFDCDEDQVLPGR